MSELMLHSGAAATLEQVAAVPLPEMTKSYMPLPHIELINELKLLAEKLIGETCEPEVGLSKDGQRLFGIIPMKRENPLDLIEINDVNLTPSIGFRNSYDKSMSAGICFGFKVFVCDNLAFRGDVTILRKHTKNLRDDLTAALVKRFMGFDEETYQMAIELKNLGVSCDKYRMAELSGRAAYEGILSPTQFNEVIRQIRTSKHFPQETLFALYQHGTEALKSTPVIKIMQQYKLWHEYIINLN